MSDISLEFGGDLVFSATGDILTSTGPQETLERVLRRLLTNAQSSTNPVGDYIWDQSYGAGLGAMIGSPANANRITAIIRQQMLNEASVSQNPPPQVSVVVDLNGYTYATIQYTEASSGQPATMNFTIG